MDSNKSSLNPSSILDLKAELHKKYAIFQTAKSQQKSEPSKLTSFKYKGQPVPKEKKSKIKEVIEPSERDPEEEIALKKSQLALEAKAKFYEKITSNNILIDDEDNEKYMVDFHRKVLYSTPTTAAPEKIGKNQSHIPTRKDNSDESYTSQIIKEIYEGKSAPSDSKKIPKLEDELTDQPIHYQNILFNEVRDHGVGYFAFSTDETKRKKQMKELHKLRQETEEQRLATNVMQKKRKEKLEARLAKVCQRRNIDQSVIQAYTKTQDSENADTQQDIDLSSIPLPAELPEKLEKKPVKVRPWDIGKTDFAAFVPERKKMKSQNDYVEDRRSERLTEFAPPPSY